MKLYGHPMSTCTRKVLTTLAEKGHEAQFVVVDLMKGEQKHPEHLARHPFGVVPVLEEDDGSRLYESRAIIRYLDRKLSGPSLTPADPLAYGRMEQFISVESSYFSGPAMKIVMKALMKRDTPDSVIEQSRKDLEKPLEVIDAVLAKQQFLAGDSFSLAEVTWLPYLEYLHVAGEGALLGRYKNVSAWWERISTRPSWRKAVGR
jgi:glutathione S-transferase